MHRLRHACDPFKEVTFAAFKLVFLWLACNFLGLTQDLTVESRLVLLKVIKYCTKFSSTKLLKIIKKGMKIKTLILNIISLSPRQKYRSKHCLS